MKYTREFLAPYVQSCRSFRAVVQALGLAPNGGSQTYIKGVIRRLNLDTSHFLGRGSNAGDLHRGGSARKTADELLVVDRRKGRREHARKLRRALLELGVPEVCADCGVGVVWNGQPLRLQVDHRNGDSLDNRRENLRFLCPNCHSQTESFGTRNRRSERRAP
jgi:predicted RNA-binding Zn-ribbon protein involved in translation (DUF1610 family)